MEKAGGQAIVHILMVGLEWFDDNPGGGGRYLKDVALRLGQAGHTVSVLVPRLNPADPVWDQVGDNVALWRFEGRSLGARMLAVTRLAWTLMRGHPGVTVVHSHFAPYGLGPLYLASHLGIARVGQFQGPWGAESRVEGETGLRVWLKNWLERLAYHRCERLIVLSESFATRLTTGFGISPERVRVIPGAVDAQWFTPTASREETRRSLGWGDEPVIFVMRRLVRRMGLEVLIDAFATLRRSHPDVRLVIAGVGPLRDELCSRCAALGLGESVSWVGRLSDEALRCHYQAADLTVVPTVALEGFGLITAESLACGTPVVGTREGGTAEILAPFPQMLVAPGSAQALTSVLDAVLAKTCPTPDPATCRLRVLAHYDWPVVLARLEACLLGDRA